MIRIEICYDFQNFKADFQMKKTGIMKKTGVILLKKIH